MLKKKSFYAITLIVGIILLAVTVFLRNVEGYKTLGGVCLGIGAGLVGMSISNLWMKRLEEKEPERSKQNEIEFKDERNTIIRYRAKAVAGDITQWFIVGIAYVIILIDGPLWLTLLVVGVFLFYNIMSLYLMSKYQQEM